MTDNSDRDQLDRLDLRRALQILQNAGRPNPIQSSEKIEVGLQSLIDDLCELSMHDGLTGLVNAQYFRALLDRETDRSARTGRSCALLLLDLDHFKQINDTYGHVAGDVVLQDVGRRLRSNLRLMDTAARIGGEEFAVFLPECSPDDAVRAASRIHSAISPMEVTVGTGTIIVTASAGLVWSSHQSRTIATALLAQADLELYRAKDSGRRQLCHPPLVITVVSPEERAALEFQRPDGESGGS